MKQLIIYILFLSGILYSDTYIGYFREVDTSICMDECSQYTLETESGEFIEYIFNPSDEDLNYFLNRYVSIESNSSVTCLMCTALIISTIEISDDCEYPVQCFVDPCEVAGECHLDTVVECIANYCGGCYADFYDLEGNFVDCYIQPIEACDDLENIFFGLCDMYLGVAIVNGQCQGVSGCGWSIDGIDYSNTFFETFDECQDSCLDEPYTCEDIESDYVELHIDTYSDCIEDSDCIAVWGDCGVGLGGCHYAVNESMYMINDVEELVSLWIDEDCMEWVCDCLDLPYAICTDSICSLSYCIEENPSGCFSNGCSDNYSCLDYSETGDCVPSSCFCDEFYENWYCTEDCNGGTCHLNGDIDYDGNIDIVDVVMAVNIILGLEEPTLLSDINLDGITNVIDVILMVTLILE